MASNRKGRSVSTEGLFFLPGTLSVLHLRNINFTLELGHQANFSCNSFIINDLVITICGLACYNAHFVGYAACREGFTFDLSN